MLASASEAEASTGSATTDPFTVVKPPFLGLPPPSSPSSYASSRPSAVYHTDAGSDQDSDVAAAASTSASASGAPQLPPTASRVAVPRYSRPSRGSSVTSAAAHGQHSSRGLTGSQLGDRIAVLGPPGGAGGSGEGSVGPAAEWPSSARGHTHARWTDTDASSTHLASSGSSTHSGGTVAEFKGNDDGGSDADDSGIVFEVALDTEGDSGGAFARAALRRDPLPGRGRYAALPVPVPVTSTLPLPGPRRGSADRGHLMPSHSRHPSSQVVRAVAPHSYQAVSIPRFVLHGVVAECTLLRSRCCCS